MKNLIVLVVVSLCFAASPAFALNGYKLSRYCKIAIEAEGKITSMQLRANIYMCYATVETVFESIAQYERLVKVEEPNLFSCMPEHLALEEQVRIVYLYTRQQKKRLNLPAVQLIMEAFSQVFPCL
jgi:hypothetical protein